MKNLEVTTMTAPMRSADQARSVQFQDGTDVQRSALAKLITRVRLAAMQGDVSAQVGIGAMCYVGLGGKKDYSEAVKWFRLAASQDNANAQFNLGLAYANGYGVRRNYVLAHMWFDLVSASGNVDGAKHRDMVAAKMTPRQIAEAQRLARENQRVISKAK